MNSILKTLEVNSFVSPQEYLDSLQGEGRCAGQIKKCLSNEKLHSKPGKIFWVELGGKTVFETPQGALEGRVRCLLVADRTFFLGTLAFSAVSTCFMPFAQSLGYSMLAGASFTVFSAWRKSWDDSFSEQLALREIKKSLSPQNNTNGIRRVAVESQLT